MYCFDGKNTYKKHIHCLQSEMATAATMNQLSIGQASGRLENFQNMRVWRLIERGDCYLLGTSYIYWQLLIEQSVI